MQAPPLRFGDLHPSGDFRELAVNAQVYPEYLIEYRRVRCAAEEV